MRAASRRRYRRMTLRVRVEYRAGDEIHSGEATTLGAGGLFIATDDPLDEGSLLRVSFSLFEHGMLHEIDGRVVWNQRRGDRPQQTCGMGICFTQPASGTPLAAELEALSQEGEPEPRD